MLTTKFQIVLIVGISLILLIILNMIRRRKLELKYSLVWLLVLAVLLIFSCIPETISKLSNWIGIYSPVNMLFFLGFVFSLIIIFVLTVTVSRLSARIRRLAQMVAMYARYEGDDIESVEAVEQRLEDAANENTSEASKTPKKKIPLKKKKRK